MKLKLRERILLIVLVSVLIIGILLIRLTSKMFRDLYVDLYRNETLETLNILAADIDGEAIVSMVESGKKSQDFEELLDRFNEVKEKSTDMEFLYLVVPYDTYFVYVLEAQASRDDPGTIAKFGEIYDYTDFDYEYFLPDVQQAKATDETLAISYGGDTYSDSFTVWTPILDSEGKTAAMIESDTNLHRVNTLIFNLTGRIAGIMTGLLIILITILFFILSNTVVHPIRVLTSEVDSYENGHYKKSDYRFMFDDEIKRLSDSSHDMMNRIDYYIDERAKEAVEKEHLVAELSLAARIQGSYLPNNFPAFPDRHDFDIYASMTPAKDVGGDFYDFFMPDEDHIYLVIADVSGKGIPASLFMMVSRMAIRNAAQFETLPSKILSNANQHIIENNPENMFVTVWLGCVELSTGKLTYANAGHSRTLLYNGGVWEYVETRCGLPLAAIEFSRYRDYELTLDKGSFLFQYTDGVTEAEREDSSQFGKDRLLEAAEQLSSLNPQDVLKEIRKKVDEFVDGAPQFDDLTMLGFYYVGAEEESKEVAVEEMAEEI